MDLSREQLEDGRGYHPDDDDLSQVGIDLKAYSDIPESLQKEKASHFSNLGFGQQKTEKITEEQPNTLAKAAERDAKSSFC